MSTRAEARSQPVSGLVVAVVGVILLAFPVVAPILGWLAGLTTGSPNLDVVLPFELFPATIAGSALVLVASWVAHRCRALLAWTIAASALLTTLWMGWEATSGVAHHVPEGDWRVVGAFPLLCVTAVAALAVGVIAAGLFPSRRTR